jgi:ABC-2 type transport system permease protein
MSGLRQALSITGVALLRLARDRIGLFFTFALPMLIILLLGAAIPKGNLSVGMVAPSKSAVADDLRAGLGDDTDLTVRMFSSLSGMRTAVRRGEIDGGLVVGSPIPGHMDDAATVSLVLDPTATNSLLVRTKLQNAIAATASVMQARRTAAGFIEGDATAPHVRSVVDKAKSGARAVKVEATSGHSTGFRSVSTSAYASVGELVLFIFLISLTGAGDIVDERRLGISRRTLAAPVRALTVVVGIGLGRFAISLIQAGSIIVFTAVMFGISWGNPFGVAVIVVAFALVSTAAGLLVGAMARSAEQATSFGPVIGIALGMLGGCMWPLEIVPNSVAAIGRLTPHAWAVESLVDLMGGAAGIGRIAVHAAVLLGFAALLLPLGAWRLRRSIG